MALLGYVFVRTIYSGWLGLFDMDTANNYTAGLIILSAAPCTAMVFVWSYLTDGDGPYTLAQACRREPGMANGWWQSDTNSDNKSEIS